MVDCDDEDSAGGGLEGDFAKGEGECGEEFLGVLFFLIHVSILMLFI